MNHYKNALKKYADFRTRARRSEYWYFTLMNAVFVLILSLLDAVLGFGSEDTLGIFGGLYSLFVIIPSIAVCIRRLHDIGKSGWWICIAIIPFIGALILFIFAIRDSQPGANQYGPNPKDKSINSNFPSTNDASTLTPTSNLS